MMSRNDTFDSFTDIPTTAQGFQKNSVVDTLDVYMIAIGVVGILDNGFALIVAIFYCNIGETLTGRLIIHQTIIDFVSANLLSVQHLLYMTGGNGFGRGNTLLANLHCWLWQSETFLWCTLLTSTFNLVAISVERYLAIVWPVYHKTNISRKMLVPIVVIVWIAGISFPLGWSVMYTHVENGECISLDFNSNTVALIYACSCFCVYYGLPLLCFIICYGQMLFIISFKKSQAKSLNKATKRLLRTLILVIMAFVLCWTWGLTDWLIISLGLSFSFAYDTLYYANIFSYISILINPIIYMAQYEQFQQGMKTMFRRMRVHPENSSTGTSVSRS